MTGGPRRNRFHKLFLKLLSLAASENIGYYKHIADTLNERFMADHAAFAERNKPHPDFAFRSLQNFSSRFGAVPALANSFQLFEAPFHVICLPYMLF